MRSRGFTLLEIVLAIGLSGAVIALLTTAIHLYLVRVDASRAQVETAQLARTILNQLANDIRAARYQSSGDSTEDFGESELDSALATDAESLALGIFGTATELRIDRSAAPSWQSIAAQQDVATEDASLSDQPLPQHMPQTVRYVLQDGKELLVGEWAKQGVSAELTAQGYAGLYREQIPTAVWLAENLGSDLAASTSNDSAAQLYAPEVVSIEFGYFDGTQLLAEWDCSTAGELPAAIEIKLTLLKEPFLQDTTDTITGRDQLRNQRENLVEFRRFVRLTPTDETDTADSSGESEQEFGEI